MAEAAAAAGAIAAGINVAARTTTRAIRMRNVVVPMDAAGEGIRAGTRV